MKNNSNGAKDAASKRGSYIRGLALKWLRLHRPDVMELIMQESYKKYPLSGSNKMNISLSKELANLK